MDLATLRDYCLKKRGATEDTPFGPEVLALRVCGKIFALAPMESVPGQVNLKCDPELAVELRDRYEGVRPGYHMNKKHWNTVEFDGSVPDREIYRMVDHSYDVVAKSLRKTDREALNG
jgi:predicted DNA-binding protein (MmcQ/YjbR family)